MKIHPRTYKKMTDPSLTAGQKLKMWQYYIHENRVNAIINQLSIEHAPELHKPYLSKNAYFPAILDHLYEKDMHLADLFIHCFYPRAVYKQYVSSRSSSD